MPRRGRIFIYVEGQFDPVPEVITLLNVPDELVKSWRYLRKLINHRPRSISNFRLFRTQGDESSFLTKTNCLFLYFNSLLNHLETPCSEKLQFSIKSM